jgi:hypothetical protein
MTINPEDGTIHKAYFRSWRIPPAFRFVLHRVGDKWEIMMDNGMIIGDIDARKGLSLMDAIEQYYERDENKRVNKLIHKWDRFWYHLRKGK